MLIEPHQKAICNIAAIEQAILIVGSMSKLGKAIGISTAKIYAWKKGICSPEISFCYKIGAVTNGRVTCQDILPHFPWTELHKKLNNLKDK